MRHHLIPMVLGLVATTVMGCCNGVQMVRLDKDTCPLPNALSNAEKDKLIKFSLDVSGIAKGVTGGKLETELTDKTKETFPAADDVNRIFALTYAACVACRVNAQDVRFCGDTFNKVIVAMAPKKTEAGGEAAARLQAAAQYRDQLLFKSGIATQ